MSKEDDDEERMRREEEYHVANSKNNAWEYVRGRYVFLYAKDGYPVPASPKVQLASSGPFYPVTHGDKVNVQPGPDGKGIHVQLKDGSTGEIGDYRLETNGNNGVHITIYFGPVRK